MRRRQHGRIQPTTQHKSLLPITPMPSALLAKRDKIMKNNQENHTQELIDDELTPEEELEISGYQPEQIALVDQEYLIQRDGEQAEPQDKSENPLIRFAITSLLVGGVMGFCWMLWSIFFASQPVVKTPNPKVKPSILANDISDEAARLKAELALRNQASRNTEEPQKEILPPPKSVTTKPVKRTPVPKPPPPRIIRERIPSPPRIIREKIPSPAPQPTTTTITKVSPPSPVEKIDIDPFERWNELATLGQQYVSSGNINQKPDITSDSSKQTNESVTSENSPYDSNFQGDRVSKVVNTQQPNLVPTVTISSNQNNTSSKNNQQTPGEWGILNRRSPKSKNMDSQHRNSPMQVQIATSAEASVVVPVIWSQEDKNQGRFAIELQENVLSTDNRIALPKGTILITEVDSVSKENKLVKQSVIAIVYTHILHLSV